MLKQSPKAQDLRSQSIVCTKSWAAKPHLLSQRVEPPSPGYGAPGDNAFHLRSLNERWIDFSEDDALNVNTISRFQLKVRSFPGLRGKTKNLKKIKKSVDTFSPFQLKMAAHPKCHL